MFIICNTDVLQCYRRQAIPMEQAKIRPSVTLYSLDRSLSNLVWLITSSIPTRMPFLVEFGLVRNSPRICAKLSSLSTVSYRTWLFLAILPRFGPFWPFLVCMRRNSHNTTCGVKCDSIFELHVPDFLYDKKFWKLDHDFRYFLANFLLHMRRNVHKTTSGQIFYPKFEILMGYFLFEYEFWRHFRQDLYVLCAINYFGNATFSEFGDIGGGDFLDETFKRHILAWFHAFWAIDRANPFTNFCSRRVHEKRDTTKSQREVISKLFLGTYYESANRIRFLTPETAKMYEAHNFITKASSSSSSLLSHWNSQQQKNVKSLK